MVFIALILVYKRVNFYCGQKCFSSLIKAQTVATQYLNFFQLGVRFLGSYVYNKCLLTSFWIWTQFSIAARYCHFFLKAVLGKLKAFVKYSCFFTNCFVRSNSFKTGKFRTKSLGRRIIFCCFWAPSLKP